MRNSTLGSVWRRGLLVAVVASAYAAGGGSRAFAQPVAGAPRDAAKVAEAERLFKQAAVHMDAREYDAACPLLERSNALDPSSGTLLNLAECYEQRGLTASAYRTFEEAREISTRTGRTDRAEVAELRKRRLEPRLRRLVILLPKAPPPTLVIDLDGKPLDKTRWSEPVPVDPGVHLVHASADAVVDYTTRVPAPDAGVNTSVPIPLQSRNQAQPPQGHGLDAQRAGAVACAVLGAAGVATGTVFGLRSQSKHEQSDQYCTGRACRDSRGVTLMEDARRAGTVSTVGFIVGGVGLGAAAVLWFVRPFGREASAVEVGIGPAAVRVAGRW